MISSLALRLRQTPVFLRTIGCRFLAKKEPTDSKCTKVKGGCQSGRNPPSCKRSPSKKKCRKQPTPFPSFSECKKDKPPPKPENECDCWNTDK